MKKEITFNDLPLSVNRINDRLDSIERLLLEKQNGNLDSGQPQWFNLDEVINYDPAKRTKPTWYSMVSRGQVPYHKSGNRLMFLKSEIDEWLKSGKHKTMSEIKDEVHSYLVNKKRKG